MGIWLHVLRLSKISTLLICFLTCCFRVNAQTELGISKQLKRRSVDYYGAKGDGKSDDTRAILKCLIAEDTILFLNRTYLIRGQIKVKELTGKTIIATGAAIVNVDNSKGTLLFDKGGNIEIIGGKWTRKSCVKEEGKTGQEHTFTFVGTSNVNISDVEIAESPQMGICLMNVIGATIKKCKIHDCFRDGIYAHYSFNISYLDNYLTDIKDDAMSMHDYGIPGQKAELTGIGIEQAGKWIVKNNRVKNCYQGIASIGCENIEISGNRIDSTVNAGIAVFNSATMFKGGNAYVNNVLIANNYITNSGGSCYIMKKRYDNGGQLTSGRSALFIAVNDNDNLINNPHSRLSNIWVLRNVVRHSYVNGAYIAQIDNLTFSNNNFFNCNIGQSNFSGRIVEIRNCSKVVVANNGITDSRRPPLHDAGYELRAVTGTISGWSVSGFRDKNEGYLYDR